MIPREQQHEHAFAMMTLDIVQSVLRQPDNLAGVVDHLLEMIRELSGARTTIMFRCGQEPGDPKEKNQCRLLGINPKRRRSLVQSPEMVRLLDIVYDLPGMTAWDPGKGNGEAESLLERLGYGLSLLVPLNVGEVRMGIILILGLMDRRHVESIIKMQKTLSSIVALILRNSILIENQQNNIARLQQVENELKEHREHLEELVASRTADLIRINRELQREVAERKRAEEKLKGSLKEKELLIKEIHHRVKNNMAVISSLLHLKARAFDQPEVISAFEESQGRIKSMALIHEKLYSAKSLSQIDFADYARDLVYQILATVSQKREKIAVKIDVTDITMAIDCAIPCGLIINELVTNACKYAFPGERRGTLLLKLSTAGDHYTLVVGDDGAGLPEDIDFKNLSSFGLYLVNILTEQLEGKLDIDRKKGTTFTITFPITID
jgi:two-component sensor histidine kinase